MFLVTYFNNLFDKGICPRDWAKAIIVPIHKKRNVDLPDNYRDVSLLSIISKCYTSMLEDNNKIAEEQAGFRKKYSTTDDIFLLNAIVQKHLEKHGAKMYVAFVDFHILFDIKIQPILMYASEIWGTMRLDGIEKVHMMACKRLFGVPLRTPNKMVYGELGRDPLFVNSTLRCLKY